jgi:hypothetical protein
VKLLKTCIIRVGCWMQLKILASSSSISPSSQIYYEKLFLPNVFFKAVLALPLEPLVELKQMKKMIHHIAVLRATPAMLSK